LFKTFGVATTVVTVGAVGVAVVANSTQDDAALIVLALYERSPHSY